MAMDLIPDNAPFTPEQRAWLNGFFAGVLSLDQRAAQTTAVPSSPLPAVEEEEEDYPWHDETIALDERMKLAEGRPYELQLMAAMGQMDCGQCGYLCKTYAEVIARGEEEDLTLCVPGGRTTARKVKELVASAPAPASSSPVSVTVVDGYTRKNPFSARLKESAMLNKNGSIKDTRHVVIDLAGSGIHYEPGDSLGIFPHNCPDLVQAILDELGATGKESIRTPRDTLSARAALLEEFDITKPSDEAIEHLATRATDAAQAGALKALAEAGAEQGQDLLELLQAFPSARSRVEELVPTLGRLQPRLFSVASSLKVHPEEVHLTVGVIRYDRNGRQRKGVASTFFADRMHSGDEGKVYIQPAHDFRLPADGGTSIIMVGPGTGIAPFRAFLQERKARGDKGKNWLFFGNPHSQTDFLYQEDFEAYLKEGILTRLDTAFSRDQAKKVYVQHTMLEHAAQIWSWLKEGAYFYVCGDMNRMARDVDQALHQIVEEQGDLSEADARVYVKKLAKDKRYLRDVY